MKIEVRRAEIRTQLGAIAKDQADIKNELSQTHQEMLKAFEQVASKNIAADIEVTIESLWTTYTLNYATAVDPAKISASADWRQALPEKPGAAPPSHGIC